MTLSKDFPHHLSGCIRPVGDAFEIKRRNRVGWEHVLPGQVIKTTAHGNRAEVIIDVRMQIGFLVVDAHY